MALKKPEFLRDCLLLTYQGQKSLFPDSPFDNAKISIFCDDGEGYILTPEKISIKGTDIWLNEEE